MRAFICLLLAFLGPVLLTPAFAGSEPSRLAAAARGQVGVTVIYDPSYTALPFPGGDLPRDRGVCTDVVVRALRDGWGIDLQLAVNRDMTAAFSAYPAFWGLTAPDSNIDHRRVPNLKALFARIGAEVPLTDAPTPYLPGDIVTWALPGNVAHMGIVSDRLGPDGTPLILHNMGAGVQEEDILFAYPMTGHFRIGADQAARLKALTEERT